MSIDFGIIVSTGYDKTETNIVLNQSFGSFLPNPLFSGSFNLLWWNSSDYINPSDDPNLEIVRCIARYGDTLIVLRSQQGTLNSDKNIYDKTYSMLFIPEIKDLSYYNIHGKARHDSTTVDGGASLSEGQITFNSSTGHYHTGTDSKAVDHINLANKGTNTHATIDSKITTYDSHTGASTGIHGVTGNVIGTSDSQTLTNKTITDSTNNVMAKSLKSATTTVDVSAATAPTIGQILTATSSTAATWQSMSSAVLTSLLLSLSPSISGWNVATPSPASEFVDNNYDLFSTTGQVGDTNANWNGARTAYYTIDLGSEQNINFFIYRIRYRVVCQTSLTPNSTAGIYLEYAGADLSYSTIWSDSRSGTSDSGVTEIYDTFIPDKLIRYVRIKATTLMSGSSNAQANVFFYGRRITTF